MRSKVLSFKLLRISAKLPLTLLLSFQLLLSPLAWAGPGELGRGPVENPGGIVPPPQIDELSEFADRLDNLQDIDPDLKQGIDAKDVESLVGKQDPYLVGGQEATYYNSSGEVVQTVALDRAALSRQRPAVTLIKPTIDPVDGSLVIEGYRGTDHNGQGGMLVARQKIPQVKPATLTLESGQDKELLMIVDENGNVHAIDWGFVALHAFEAPVLVFQNLHHADIQSGAAKLDPATTRAELWTPGRTPFTEQDIAPNAIVPRDPQTGQIILKGGDLIVSSVAGQTKTVLGVYSRRITHLRVASASEIVDLMYDLLEGDAEAIEKTKELLKRNEAEHADFLDQISRVEAEANNPVFDEYVRAIPPNAIQTLKSRILDHRKYANRNVDFDTLDGWARTYEGIKARLGPEKSEEDLAKNWQQAFKQRHPEEKEFNLNLWTAVALGTYMGAGATIGHFESLQQVQALSWMYMHAIPDVLKDAAYRWPLLESSFWLTMMWPAAVVASWSSGKALNILAAVTSESPSAVARQTQADVKNEIARRPGWKRITSMHLHLYSAILGGFAKTMAVVEKQKTWDTVVAAMGEQKILAALGRQIRDLNKTWGQLSIWQRITSVSNRVYPELILGAWISTIERFFGQKTFFLAWNNGVNPLKKITPDSELGERLGLEDSIRIGVPNTSWTPWPFKKPQGYNEAIQKRVEAISILKAKADRKKAQAWLMAAGAIAEQYGIDLATLLLMENGKRPTLQDLQALFDNPKALEEWEILTEELHKEMVRQKVEFEIEKDGEIQIDSDAVLEQMEKARAMAVQLVALDPTGKILKKMKIAAGRRAVAFKHWFLNLGRKEFNALKKLYTNEDVAGQVEREFVSDHLLTVFQVALFGPRADLTHPADLAANASGFLKTTPAHWNDMGVNVNIHLFFSGARTALVYQTIKSVDEHGYDPREDFQYASKPKSEPFFPAAWRFIKGLAPWDENSADIGGVFMRTWRRQLNTLQASLIVPLLFRVLPPADQPFHLALTAVVINWLLQNYYFYSPNLVVQGGSLANMGTLRELNNRLMQAKTLLAQSEREPDAQKAAEMREVGLSGIYKLYREQKPSLSPQVESLGNDVGSILRLAVENPPVATRPNKVLLDGLPWGAGILNVYLATNFMVYLWHPENLTAWNLLSSAGISAAITAVVYAVLAKRPWEVYKEVYKNPGSVLQKIRSLFKEKSTCEEALE